MDNLICYECDDDFSNVINADISGHNCNHCKEWFCSEGCYYEHCIRMQNEESNE